MLMNSPFGKDVDPGTLARSERRGAGKGIGPIRGIRVDMIGRREWVRNVGGVW